MNSGSAQAVGVTGVINMSESPDEVKGYDQWVVWRAEEDPNRKKRRKIPYSPKTGKRTGTTETDRSAWGTFENAVEAFTNGKYSGIGFVFTQQDPFVGIDLDHCAVDGQPDSWAKAIIEGGNTYTEISPSGTGFHLIVRGRKPGIRCKKPRASLTKNEAGDFIDDLEMYDQERYFTMTGRAINKRLIQQNQTWLESLYRSEIEPDSASPPTQHTHTGGGRGRNKEPGYYRIPEDDTELLKDIERSKKADDFFRLYRGDTSENGGDHSAADLALCRRLAFWTGKDFERMDRMFRSSQLMRGKWDERRGGQTYGQITLRKALNSCTSGEYRGRWYPLNDTKKRGNIIELPNRELDDDPLNYVYSPRGEHREITFEERQILEEMNSKWTHTQVSGKHILVRTVYNPVEGESIAFEPKSEFRNYFLTDAPIAGLNRGTAWLGWRGKNAKLGGVAFQPATNQLPDNNYNLFTGYKLNPKRGDCSPWLDLLRVTCSGNSELAKTVTQFFAHMLQKPDEKPTWGILFKSLEGTGKGSLIKPFKTILGRYFIHMNGVDQLVQRFNGAVSNRLLMFVDEVQVNTAKEYNKLRGVISEPTISMESKGVDVIQIQNLARLVFASNHDRVLLAGQRERRYLILTPDDTYIGDKDFWGRFNQWLGNGGPAHLMEYLLNYDISDFSPFKPPVTQALIDEKTSAMPYVQQWLYEWLESAACSENTVPFPCRMEGRELARKYRDWTMEHLRESIAQRPAETEIGNLFGAMGIQKTRRMVGGIRQPRMYEFENIEIMQERFAGIMGHERNEIFED